MLPRYVALSPLWLALWLLGPSATALPGWCEWLRLSPSASLRQEGPPPSAEDLVAPQISPQLFGRFRSLFPNYAELAEAADVLVRNKPAYAALSTEQRVALFGYANKDHAASINRALWSGNRRKLRSLAPYIQMLASALELLPDEVGTGYRRVQLSPSEIARYQKGKTVYERGFTSTSRSNAISLNPNFNVRFVIQYRRGKDVSALGHAWEEEVLLSPGRFSVENVTVSAGSTLINLREIDTP